MPDFIKISILACLLSPLLQLQTAWGDNTYQYYIKTSPKQLAAESGKMQRQLRTLFSSASIDKKQQEIDFHQYLSALKKAIFFSQKLSTYTNYEEDMQFARDHEIFRMMPRKLPSSSTKNEHETKFINDKYKRMTRNIQEEIETYLDQIKLNLDECESLIGNDMDDLTNHSEFKEKIEEYAGSDEFLGFKKIQKKMAVRWPDIMSRITIQLNRWKTVKGSPNKPVINPLIIQAL